MYLARFHPLGAFSNGKDMAKIDIFLYSIRFIDIFSTKRTFFKNYSEENTPKSFKYMITYSFEKEFNQSFMVTFGTYLKSIFGATDKRNTSTGMKEVKSYINPVSSKAIVVM